MEEQIHAVFRRHRPIGRDTNFFEGGFSSSALAEVLAELGPRHPDLALVDLYHFPTVRTLAAELRRRAFRDRSPDALPWTVADGR